MSNKYLEKVALSDTVKGVVSPAWMQHSIAKKHGKKTNGAGELYGTEAGGAARQVVRSAVTGGAGAGAGLVAGAMVGSQLSHKYGPHIALAGAAAGGVAGAVHGYIKSTKNQAKEMHDRYREKKAAVDMLIENGIDFDTAVTLVAAKSAELDK